MQNILFLFVLHTFCNTFYTYSSLVIRIRKCERLLYGGKLKVGYWIVYLTTVAHDIRGVYSIKWFWCFRTNRFLHFRNANNPLFFAFILSLRTISYNVSISALSLKSTQLFAKFQSFFLLTPTSSLSARIYIVQLLFILHFNLFAVQSTRNAWINDRNSDLWNWRTE